MALLASKVHTAGNTQQWTIEYEWLDNTAEIKTVTLTSSSTSCTIGTPAPTILGRDVKFFLTGGNVGETLTVSVKMVDSFGNTKNDTIAFTVLAP